MATVPDGVRPVDYIMATVHGEEPDASIASLEAARSIPNSTLILDGDYGGQVYATCPVKYLRDVTLDDLNQLCRKVSAIQWGAEQAHDEDWSVTLVVKQVGSGVWGGMGGGKVIDGLWLHRKLTQESIDLIKTVLK